MNLSPFFKRNLQDTPNKFGPVVDPFSGGFPSPTWALPTPALGKTQTIYDLNADRRAKKRGISR